MHELFSRLLEDFRGAWRFRRYALAAAWVVCLACWAVVFVLPDEYSASARVFVDTRTARLSIVVSGHASDYGSEAEF